MPIHDWSKVEDGTFHDMHHAWIDELRRHLNRNLPTDYYAQAVQRAGPYEPDVLTLRRPDIVDPTPVGGTLLLERPKTRTVLHTNNGDYSHSKNHLEILHASGHRTVAIVEVVSAGNKSNRAALRDILRKLESFRRAGVHMLIVDVLKQTRLARGGIASKFWEKATGNPFDRVEEKPFYQVAFENDSTDLTAYIEPVGIGDPLPEMPLFLMPGVHLAVGLEETYMAAYESLPAWWRAVLDGAASE